MYRMSLMRDTLVPEFFLIDSHRLSFENNKGSNIPKRYWTVQAVEETDREEEVYCATVEGHGAFALDGNILTGNCAFVSSEGISEDFADPFCFLMDMSMLGVGTGADTKGAGKVKLQMPRTTEEPYVVEDSREGWVELIRVILNPFVGKGHYPLNIDYTGIRGRGVPLKTFGGTASGPKPLQDMVENLTRLLLPKGCKVKFDVPYHEDTGKIDVAKVKFTGSGESYRITSAIIVDIFNYIGKGVVAGGIRRTAEIMFGEPDDEEFISLKSDQKALEDRRWASNNSVYAYQGMDYGNIAARIAGNGEPGVLWLENARAFSRMDGVPDNRDWRVMGSNPCVTSDTIVMTEEGPRRVDSLIGKSFGAAVNGEVKPCENGFFKTGTRPVYLLETEEGHSLKLTADHQVLSALKVTSKKRYEEFISAEDISPGDLVVLNNNRGMMSLDDPEDENDFAVGWLLGNLLGDGYFHQGDETAHLQFWGSQSVGLVNQARAMIEKLGGDPRYHKMRTGTYVEDRDMRSTQSRQLWLLAPEYGINHDKEIFNDRLLTSSNDVQRGFLRGLFDADGSVQGSQEKGVSVRLASSTPHHLVTAQRMLLNLGINSTIYWNRRDAGEVMLPDGNGGEKLYPTKDQHELVISKDNLKQFSMFVGFSDHDKTSALDGLLGQYKRAMNRERFVATAKSLTYVGVEDVYDCQVPDIHRFSANGIVVHNCGEQLLESHELCNLVETFPAHHDDYDDYERTLKMAYLYAKTVTLVPTHVPRANAVMTRNRRIGCSMSGIIQAMVKLGRRGFLTWCDKGYDYIQRLDRIYSDWLGVPLSIKTTTVKPSGTTSLLCGATPGIHYPHSPFYIRHIRVANTSPLVEAARRAGYTVEPDDYADDTSVVAFPVAEKHFVKGKCEATIWEQFVNAADMQRHWANNAVSVTVTFNKEEIRDIQSCLESFEDRLKGVSMLPLADGDHGYKHAPYVAISEDEYKEMVARVSPIDMTDSRHEVDDKFCSGDKCEFRPTKP